MTKLKKFLKKKGKKGFSLIEVLAAVIIVAIMAALGIIMIPQLMEQSRETTDINNMREAQTLMETYVLQGGPNNTMYYNEETGSIVPSYDKATFGHGTQRDGKTKLENQSSSAVIKYTNNVATTDKKIKVTYVEAATNAGIEDNGYISVEFAQS